MRTRVCGGPSIEDCRPLDKKCNGYCSDPTIKSPGEYLTTEDTWKEDKVYVSNKLYAIIMPLLSEYESRGYNSHQRAQTIVADVVDQMDKWVIQNMRRSV